MVESDLERKIAELEKRVSILEKNTVERTLSNSISKDNASSKKYKGLTGGIIFLVDDNFFNTLRSSREVHEKLMEKGYIYRLEAVDTILRRDFVSRKKILNRIIENKIWKYGLRK